MTSPDRDNLIEQVTSAWRPIDPRTGGPRTLPAFHDLDASGRERAHRLTSQLRAMEAALDPDGTAVANPIVTVKNGKKTDPWQIDGISGATDYLEVFATATADPGLVRTAMDTTSIGMVDDPPEAVGQVLFEVLRAASGARRS